MMYQLRRSTMMCAAALIAAGVLACGGDATSPTLRNPASRYWLLTLNYHAITLATISPYDTLTLVATPRTATGAPLTTGDTVVYTSSDTSVQVSPDGKIRAHTTADLTSDVQIIATMTVGGVHGVTLADTAMVNVVAQTSPATVPVVGHFSLQRTDTAIFSTGFGGFFDAIVEDTSTVPQTIPSVQVYYYMAPSTILKVISHFGSGVQAAGIGHAMLYADAIIYGRVVRDSVRLTAGYQLQKILDIAIDSSGVQLVPRGFPPDTLFLGVGGVVIWHNVLFGLPNDSIDVEFAGPAAVQPMTDTVTTNLFDLTVNDFFRLVTVLPDGGGNISPFSALPPTVLTDSTGISIKGRRFTVPGTYTYHSRFFPGTGLIRVVPNADIP